MREYPDITNQLKHHCRLIVFNDILKEINKENKDVGIIKSKKDGINKITFIIKETN